MKKLLLGLLALPALCLAVSEASASWTICGQHSCSYSCCGPRICFGFDWGPCNAGPGAVGAVPVPAAPLTPWFNQFPPPIPHAQAPAAAPVLAQTPAAAPSTLPVSYQTGPTHGNPYSTGYQVPAYWYGR